MEALGNYYIALVISEVGLHHKIHPHVQGLPQLISQLLGAEFAFCDTHQELS